MESQTVKTAEIPGIRGYDAAKKINGRKRHALADIMGLIMALTVHSADIQDRDGAKLLLKTISSGAFPHLQMIWADGGYAGKLAEWVISSCGCT